MQLFELDGVIVKWSPQALALKPFKELWKRDRTKDKHVAFAELSLIYFSVDYRSDYSRIVDEESRYAEIRTIIDLPEKWKPDSKFNDAVKLYKDLQKTPAIQALETARIVLNKIDTFCRNIDMEEKDKAGKYVHKAADLMRYTKDLEGGLESLAKVEERVKKQIEEKVEFKGQMEPAMFEDEEDI